MNTDAMKDHLGPTQSLERLRAYAAAALAPFFTGTATGCVTTARLAAEGMLNDYQAATPNELQLSVEIIASSMATLACLSAASVAKHESIDEMLRLQRDALRLNRASDKATKVLQARRKQRATNPNAVAAAHTQWDEGLFQRAINQALDKTTAANARVEAYMASLKPVANTPEPDASITD